MNADRRPDTERDERAQFHEQQMAALYGIAQLWSSQAGHRRMLAESLAIIERHLGMANGAILLRALDSGDLVVEAVRDSAGPSQRQARYRRGEGIIGTVLNTGQPEVVPSILADPRFQGRVHQRVGNPARQASFVCVPIAIDDELVGTLSADLAQRYSEHLADAQRFLSIVAGLIAYDVHARRFGKQREEAMEEENLRLRTALGERLRPESIIGNSIAMRKVYERIQSVSASNTTVLIRGESGTGKELAAAAIHFKSPRAHLPFVRVNCAALSETLIESELFGHERGAFTGATRTRIGRIEEAKGGTLLLDEIGDFSPQIQVKLLRVLQEHEFERVGSNETRRINVRIVAATNRDLEDMVRAGTFRQDLYYRINVFPIHLPPLRERRGDVLLLADHFVQKHAEHASKEVRRISTAAINAMLAYHWPGNARELENCMEHAVLLSEDGVVRAHHLPPSLQMPEEIKAPPGGTLATALHRLERDMIVDALKRNQGNVTDAAKELGMTARMLRYKIPKLGLETLRSRRRHRD